MRRELNVVVGRVGDEFYVLDEVFEHPGGHRGAVGTTFMPLSRRYVRDRMHPENAAETLEDEWRTLVGGGAITEGLDEYVRQRLDEDGEEALWDLSCYDMGCKVAELYNAGLPPDADDDLKADFSECTGGGRCFCKDGSRNVKFADFDEIFCDGSILDLIAEFEEKTVDEEREYWERYRQEQGLRPRRGR